MSSAAARSGNPARRAAGDDDDNVTPLETEAAGGPVSFTFDGQDWELVDGFKLLRFQRMCEQQQLTYALEYALGEEQYAEIEELIETPQQMFDMANAVAAAMGVDDLGESRASRRSSKTRPRPRR